MNEQPRVKIIHCAWAFLFVLEASDAQEIATFSPLFFADALEPHPMPLIWERNAANMQAISAKLAKKGKRNNLDHQNTTKKVN